MVHEYTVKHHVFWSHVHWVHWQLRRTNQNFRTACLRGNSKNAARRAILHLKKRKLMAKCRLEKTQLNLTLWVSNLAAIVFELGTIWNLHTHYERLGRRWWKNEYRSDGVGFEEALAPSWTGTGHSRSSFLNFRLRDRLKPVPTYQATTSLPFSSLHRLSRRSSPIPKNFTWRVFTIY